MPPNELFLDVLRLAVSKGDLKTVKALASACPELMPSADDPEETNLAFLAAEQGDVAMLRYVMEDLRFEDKFAQESFGTLTPLHMACSCGNEEAVKYLLDRNMPLNVQNERGQNPLHFAAGSKSAACVKILLDKGLSAKTADFLGNLPIHAAARSGSGESIRSLLQAGSPLDAPNPHGNSPFQIAQEIGNSSAIVALHAAGAPLGELRGSGMSSALLQGLDTFKEAYKVDHPGEKVPFALFLAERGYSATLENVDFSSFMTNDLSDVFKNVDFSGITFKGCSLAKCNFSDSNFTNCQFLNSCTMHDCIFSRCSFSDCQFQAAQLCDSLFEGVSLNHVQFLDKTDLSYVGFNDATTLSEVDFDSCKMLGANFFGTKSVERSEMKGCDLENCLLFEARAEFHFHSTTVNIGKMTQPTVAIAWNTQSPGTFAQKAVVSLKATDAIPLKFNYLPPDVETDMLKRQATNLLSSIQRSHVQTSSRPQMLLKAADENSADNSEIGKLITRAKEVVKHVDAILLPGGDDVEPEFYGQPRSEDTETAADYRRTVYEFAVIRQAREMGLPLMGICRGSQMGNIFYGGALRQDVGGQHKEQILERVPPAKDGAIGTIRALAFGKEQDQELEAASRHHQASKTTGQNIEVVVEHKRIIKAMEGTQGAPFMLLQFHPEYLDPQELKLRDPATLAVSPQNYALFEGFRDAAEVQRLKKNILNRLPR